MQQEHVLGGGEVLVGSGGSALGRKPRGDAAGVKARVYWQTRFHVT